MSDLAHVHGSLLQLAPDPSDQAEDLLAQCLALPDAERGSAIERICLEKPELADELRMRVAALRAMGIELSEARGFPEQLGDFRLIELLGGGGMGVVYLAVQTSLQRDVALKLIRPEHLYFAGARAFQVSGASAQWVSMSMTGMLATWLLIARTSLVSVIICGVG